MRTFVLLVAICGTAMADCVIYADKPDSINHPFNGENIVICELMVSWPNPIQPPDADLTEFLSRPATMTWKPWSDGDAGFLEIKGDGISLYDASGFPRITRYGGGFYEYSQEFGGVGFGYDVDFELDPEAATMIDDLSFPGMVTVTWYQNMRDGIHSVGVIASGNRVRYSRSGGTSVATAVPEPSAFACLGLIGLIAAANSWRKRRV